MQPFPAAFIGGWEVVLVLALILVLLGAKKLPDLCRGIGSGFFGGLGEFKKAVLEVLDQVTGPADSHRDLSTASRSNDRRPGDAFLLWVAQGFGIGRAPFSPGTFGSVVGVLWFALLASFDSLALYLFAAIEGVALSVWLCDEAERIMGKTDPGSVVLDEIIALPFCFLPWVVCEWLKHGHHMAPVSTYFHGKAWIAALLIFGLFRLFDIWKPAPIRQLQRLPGGWGITIDDLLAAVYVAVVSLLFVR